MKSDKKDSILDAAVAEFTRHGFRQASIDEIARRAGVAKGTVYLACESKEDLFYQAVRREMNTWGDTLAVRLDPQLPAEEMLERAATESLAFMESRPLVLDLFIGLYHSQLPAWAARFEELRSFGHLRVAEVLRRGVAQGRFRTDLDVDETATVLLDIQVALYIWRRRTGDTRPDSPALARRRRAIQALVLNGLMRRSPGDTPQDAPEAGVPEQRAKATTPRRKPPRG